MSRLLWVGVGAAGGIYGYRRSQQAWQRAKDRGVVGTATVMAAATTSALQSIRTAVTEQGAATPRRSAGAAPRYRATEAPRSRVGTAPPRRAGSSAGAGAVTLG